MARKRRTGSRWRGPVKTPARGMRRPPGRRGPGGTVTTPGSPGVLTARVDPYLEAQDMFQRAEFQAARDRSLADLDAQLAEAQANATFNLREVERGAKVGRAGALDANAARGIFHSSLRDAALIDVDTNELIQRETIQRGLDLMRQRADRERAIWSQQEQSYDAAEAQRMIENARAANEGVPLYVPGKEPVAATTRQVPGAMRPTGMRQSGLPSAKRPPKLVARRRQPTTRTPRRPAARRSSWQGSGVVGYGVS